MWIIAKYNSNQLEIFKKSLSDILGSEVSFYQPKISLISKKKKILKNILGDYIFCKHSKFSDNNVMSTCRYLKGLKYFLPNFKSNQTDINKFINNCNKHEDKNKILQQSFFDQLIKMKAKFISGPFKRFIFEIINKNKNNFVAKINNLRITVKNKDKYFLPL